MAPNNNSNDNNNNGQAHDTWSRHEEYVLHELRSIRLDFREHQILDASNFKELQTTMVEIKTKIATWGAIIAGAVTIAQPLISKAAQLFLGK